MRESFAFPLHRGFTAARFTIDRRFGKVRPLLARGRISH